MSSSSEAQLTDRLRRPLIFASKDNYARIERVKLEDAVTSALAEWETKHGITKKSRSLREAAKGLDALPVAEKKARIAQLLHGISALSQPSSERAPPAPTTTTTTDSRALKAPGRRTPSDADLRTPLSSLVGLGPKTSQRLSQRGLHTVHDLLFFLPRRYQDRSRFVPIGELEEGMHASVRGRVRAAVVRRAGPRRRMLEIAVTDGTGNLSCRFFRFSKAFEEMYGRDSEVTVFGQVRRWGAMLQMIHPEIALLSESSESVEPEGVLPVYPDIDGVPAKKLRTVLRALALGPAGDLDDPLPGAMRDRLGLSPIADAVRAAHVPDAFSRSTPKTGADTPGEAELQEVRSRLVFDELFFLQLALGRIRQDREAKPGLSHAPEQGWRTVTRALFPFELTKAQDRTLSEVCRDLGAPRPMNRLVQGDVGSGKTAVALAAAAVVNACGRQTALLAPTEILAMQHFQRACSILEPAGLVIGLLTGSTRASERRSVLVGLASGAIRLVVGTHALLESPVAFDDLGLAIVDEQHRFGVEQRTRLVAKRADVPPDVMVMTATPIPRTLALTVYGDLCVSMIDEMPPGRAPTVTQVFGPKRRARAHAVLQAELEAGRQAYVIFPLVEASDKVRAQSLEEAQQELVRTFAPHTVEVVHGRLKPDDKRRVMQRFHRGEVQVLMSTTVVEVGVDVANATVMMIENAERFGLSQLHQLRGRVGRGTHRGLCLLVAESPTEDARARLAVMASTTDGFEIAERDLEIRGPGELLGTKQSGLPEIVYADLVRDAHVVERAREEALAILEADPELKAPDHRTIRDELVRRFRDRMRLARAG